ncbi:hypothetical protein FBU59_002353 [Linderina macrospora]|uniref:Uncharacterized protein n=1 Tax=Linderina macrospora TaxID=4868 RepID=A0ACC1JBJ8_9FUNG|nr:hypothetical protein FBU59_002353 [Linderina macrospora]
MVIVPTLRKPLGSNTGSKPQIGGFKGFKLPAASSPLPKPLSALNSSGAKATKLFEKPADDSPKPIAIVAVQEGTTIVGEGEQAQGPLVIPSKRNANWMHHTRKQPRPTAIADSNSGDVSSPQADESPDAPAQESPSLRDEAIRELKMPGTMAEREQLALDEDIGACAEEAGEDAYERVPVEEFGLAMLRGMGWKDGGPVGRRGRSQVDPESVVQAPRPSLLGLGAKPRPDDSLQPRKNKAS